MSTWRDKMAEDTSYQTSLENSSAEALLSMKEGKGSYPQSPTKRGHPSRIRKPNTRIFALEDHVTPKKKIQSPMKTLATSVPMTLSTPDKKAAQSVGVKLRNFLKLHKAHRWVCYEWFYSNIDRPLFEGENDFSICMRDSFPQLKTRMLTRLQWCKIRRLMGKPRRCSPAFFTEERAALHRKRKKIHLCQQRKAGNIADELKDLPEEIPMSLVVGTKVTARLRRPQDGLFTGTVDALDFTNMTYRISFDRPGLGTHSVPDIEVLSNDFGDTMPLSVFLMKHRPSKPAVGIFTPPRSSIPPLSPGGLVGDNDPLLGSSPLRPTYPEGSTYGGFPVEFLIVITKLTKILAVKKERIKELRDFNTKAEKLRSFGDDFEYPFQQQYASVVLELHQLNKELHNYLVGLQHQCAQISPEQGATPLDQSIQIKAACDDNAIRLVTTLNGPQDYKNSRRMVREERSVELITKLTSLLYQLKTLSENEMHSFEFKSLQDSLDEIKAHIDPENLSVMQNNVEIHVNHVQSGITQMGNLHAFTSTANSH